MPKSVVALILFALVPLVSTGCVSKSEYMKTVDAANALEVVSRLPPAYQAPFLLRYLEGMNGPEAAEAAGVEAAEFRTAVDGARRLFERELKHSLEGAES